MLFVCDYLNNRVQVFDAVSGLFLHAISQKGMRDPTSVSYIVEEDNKLRLFIVFSRSHCIMVVEYNFRGKTPVHKVIGFIGSGPGSAAGQLRYPVGSTIFQTSNRRVFLLVTEHGNNRVQMFDAYSLAHVAIIAENNDSSLLSPWDIKIATSRNAKLPNQRLVFISEFYRNDRIQTIFVDFDKYLL